MSSLRGSDGYRHEPAGGARIRTDIVDGYVFRRMDGQRESVELLQLQRARAPLAGAWHPVMGHIEAEETSVQTIVREVREELALTTEDHAWLGMWALEQVHPFYVVVLDCVVMSPRFVIEVRSDWEPTLNHEHLAYRWVHQHDTERLFAWPGQKHAIAELLREIAPLDSPTRELLRVDPGLPG